MDRHSRLKSRRQGTRGVAVGLSTLALATGGWFGVLPLIAGEDQAVAGRGKPNVVVILTDDQALTDMRVMRNVKRLLARRGTTFKNAFATFPLCCPSRATFLTGQYAHNHRVMSNRPPTGGYERFNDARTLPVSMRHAGYRTGYVGKYLNGYDRSSIKTRRQLKDIPPGWQQWDVLLTGLYFKWKLNNNGRIERYGTRESDYQTDVLARKAAGFVRRGAKRRSPFFLTFAPKAPHIEQGKRLNKSPNPRPAPRHEGRFRDKPLPTPPSFNEKDVSDKPSFVRRQPRLDSKARRALERRYQDRLASLLAVDDAVKRIVKTLRKANELRKTLIVFTSDNGFLLGHHRLRGKGKLYEETARVPLVLSGPGVPSGRKRRQLVGNIDLAPTILDVAGAKPARVMDGRSLIPLARKRGAASGRDLLFENAKSQAVRTRRYMYAEHPNSELELYDLKTDPFQLRSRHNDPALGGVRSSLARRLDQLRSCAGASCR